MDGEVAKGARARRLVSAAALAVGLGAGTPAALAQEDGAPLGPDAVQTAPQPCDPVHRTSPEFLAAFAGMPTGLVEGDAEDAIARAFRAPQARASRGPAAERILSSAMLPTAQTTFDAQWRRVRDNALDASCAAVLLGRRPPESRLATVGAVNAWVNRNIRYLQEGRDRWADAAATLRARRGDCEDLAILKLQLLAALGVPLQDLYLTLAYDLVRRRDHAVLVVRAGENFVLLDNSTDRLLDARRSNDYRPILSYSRDRKWLHGS